MKKPNILTRAYYKIKRTFPANEWYVKGHPWLSIRRVSLYSYLQLKRSLHLDKSFYAPEDSDILLDIFMPTVEKDAEVLTHSISALKKQVRHPIGNIYIVAPKNAERVKKVAAKEGGIFVDEETILPINKSTIDYVHKGENRAGWIYKMLLNLNSDSVCKERYILIVDSDTIFIRPQIFLYKNKPLFNLGESHHTPYFKANMNIFKLGHKSSRSFITHYMLFDSMVLKKLRTDIEAYQRKPWYQAIIENIDRSGGSGFADYEIYGDYYTNRLKLPSIQNCWSNISLEINRFDDFEKLIESSRNKYSSISFHNYNRN